MYINFLKKLVSIVMAIFILTRLGFFGHHELNIYSHKNTTILFYLGKNIYVDILYVKNPEINIPHYSFDLCCPRTSKSYNIYYSFIPIKIFSIEEHKNILIDITKEVINQYTFLRNYLYIEYQENYL